MTISGGVVAIMVAGVMEEMSLRSAASSQVEGGQILDKMETITRGHILMGEEKLLGKHSNSMSKAVVCSFGGSCNSYWGEESFCF